MSTAPNDAAPIKSGVPVLPYPSALGAESNRRGTGRSLGLLILVRAGKYTGCIADYRPGTNGGYLIIKFVKSGVVATCKTTAKVEDMAILEDQTITADHILSRNSVILNNGKDFHAKGAISELAVRDVAKYVVGDMVSIAFGELAGFVGCVSAVPGLTQKSYKLSIKLRSTDCDTDNVFPVFVPGQYLLPMLIGNLCDAYTHNFTTFESRKSCLFKAAKATMGHIVDVTAKVDGRSPSANDNGNESENENEHEPETGNERRSGRKRRIPSSLEDGITDHTLLDFVSFHSPTAVRRMKIEPDRHSSSNGSHTATVSTLQNKSRALFFNEIGSNQKGQVVMILAGKYFGYLAYGTPHDPTTNHYMTDSGHLKIDLSIPGGIIRFRTTLPSIKLASIASFGIDADLNDMTELNSYLLNLDAESLKPSPLDTLVVLHKRNLQCLAEWLLSRPQSIDWHECSQFAMIYEGEFENYIGTISCTNNNQCTLEIPINGSAICVSVSSGDVGVFIQPLVKDITGIIADRWNLFCREFPNGTLNVKQQIGTNEDIINSNVLKSGVRNNTSTHLVSRLARLECEVNDAVKLLSGGYCGCTGIVNRIAIRHQSYYCALTIVSGPSNDVIGKRTSIRAENVQKLSEAEIIALGWTDPAATVQRKGDHSYHLKYVRIINGSYKGYIARICAQKLSPVYRCRVLLQWQPNMDLTSIETSMLQQRKETKLYASGFVCITPLCPEYEATLRLQEIQDRPDALYRRANSSGTIHNKGEFWEPETVADDTFDELENGVRNNLYWVSEPFNCACVWYCGDRSALHESEPVEVHLISLAEPPIIETSINDSGRHPPESAVTVMVPQNILNPLENVEITSVCANQRLGWFLLCLLEFSEWDDCLRGSYVWPRWIFKLITDPYKLAAFLYAALHRVPLRHHYGPNDTSKYFVMLLCAKHLGVTDEYLSHSDNLETLLYAYTQSNAISARHLLQSTSETHRIANDSLPSSESCTATFLFHMNQVFGVTLEAGDDCAEVIRMFSRCGADYQVELLESDMDDFTTALQSTGSIFQPDVVSDEMLLKYIHVSQLILELALQSGQLLQCPKYDSGTTPLCKSATLAPPLHHDDDVGLLALLRRHEMTGGRFPLNDVMNRRYTTETFETMSNLSTLTLSTVAANELVQPSSSRIFCTVLVLNFYACSMTPENIVVKVFDGKASWYVPLSSCRLLNFEEEVLELLAGCQYNLFDALHSLHGLKIPCSIRDSGQLWFPADFYLIQRLGNKHGDNVCKVVQAMQHAVLKPYHSHILTSLLPDKVTSSDFSHGATLTVRSSKALMSLYFWINQGNGDFAVDTYSISLPSTTFSNAVTEKGPQDLVVAIPMTYPISDETLQLHTAAAEYFMFAALIRWPQHLPRMYHNIYWLKLSSSPCICLGVDDRIGSVVSKAHDSRLKVITIRRDISQRQMTVQSTVLEPLNDVVLEHFDSKILPYLFAVIDFCGWEIVRSRRCNNADVLRWYSYPSFIIRMLEHAPTGTAWRKQAERQARGKCDDRRSIYFNALVTDYFNLPETSPDRNRSFGDIPWVEIQEETPPSMNASGQEVAYSDSDNWDEASEGSAHPSDNWDQLGHEEEVQQIEDEDNEYETEEYESEVDNHEEDEDCDDDDCEDRDGCVETDEASVPEATRAIVEKWSHNGLYWLSKGLLPCILVDRGSDYVVVQPVCCLTYHYLTTTYWSFIEPLSPSLLSECHDERTQDFASAMIAFADWDINRIQNSGTRAPAASDEFSCGSISADNQEYLWPKFISDMITSPREWASWRKRVERKIQRPTTRRNAYLVALLEQYSQILASTEASN